jgi:hypothetical protein
LRKCVPVFAGFVERYPRQDNGHTTSIVERWAVDGYGYASDANESTEYKPDTKEII